MMGGSEMMRKGVEWIVVIGLVLSLWLGMITCLAADDERKPGLAPIPGEAMQPDRSPSRNAAGLNENDATREELRRLRAELEELKRLRRDQSPATPTLTSTPAATPPASEAKPEPSSETAELVAERARLKARLFDLLERIPSRQVPAKNTPAAEPPPELNSETFRPVDRIRYVQNLIKAGQYATALRTFQVLDPSNFSGKQGAMLRYLQASAHRRAGDLEAAKKLYAELAQSREDDFLAECAAWQLQAIRTREELSGRLDTTRAGRPNW